MSYLPNELDIKTDLRRSIMASFSPKKFADPNFKIFMKNVKKNLELLTKTKNIKYEEVKKRIIKAGDSKQPIEKRREDLLTAASLV